MDIDESKYLSKKQKKNRNQKHYANRINEFGITNRRLVEIKNYYGLDGQSYAFLLKEQNNSCAVCTRSFGINTPHVDHDHTTKKVRGLLCGNCNNALGCFQDNIQRLEAAIKYLDKHKELK